MILFNLVVFFTLRWYLNDDTIQFRILLRFGAAADRMMSSDVNTAKDEEIYIQNLRRQKLRKRTKDGMNFKR